MSLAATALAFGYRGTAISRDLELQLERGEVLCILGPNGAGKTTLLRTLLGLLPPVSGRVTLDGVDLHAMSRTQVAQRLAYVPQDPGAMPGFQVGDAVLMGRTSHLGAFGAPGERDMQACADALQRVGIGQLAARPLEQLSGGERQLVAIARALATGAEFLVMDEPAAHLDLANECRVLQEVARLRDERLGILLCTQQPGHALAISDRTLLLGRGGVLALGPTNEVLNSASVSRLYGIPVSVAEVEVGGEARTICMPQPISRGGTQR